MARSALDGSYDEAAGDDDRIGRYNRVAMTFHWVIAALIIVNLTVGIFADQIEYAYGFSPMPGHKSIGLTVLVLSVLRLLWRLAHRPPPLPSGSPAWERGTAHGVHWAFYFFMIAMPVTGWMMSSAGKFPLTWFGLFPVAKLPIAKGSVAAEIAHNGHGLMGWLLLALVVLHIGAALRHRIILNDGITRRMGVP